MNTIAGLSSNALYAKAKALFAEHLTAGVYEELAGMTDLAEFTSFLRTNAVWRGL